MLRTTGDPRLDRLILDHPALGRHIERELRFGQTRWTEIWLACVMAIHGIVLVAGGGAVALEPGRAVVQAPATGYAVLALGLARLAALLGPGARIRSPLVRTAGCVGGFLFYAALAAGLGLAAPPVPTGLVYGVLALAELHASGRSARDAVASDSLGVRRRRRSRVGRAP